MMRLSGGVMNNATRDKPPVRAAKEEKKLEELSRRLNEQAPDRRLGKQAGGIIRRPNEERLRLKSRRREQAWFGAGDGI